MIDTHRWEIEVEFVIILGFHNSISFIKSKFRELYIYIHCGVKIHTFAFEIIHLFINIHMYKYFLYELSGSTVCHIIYDFETHTLSLSISLFNYIIKERAMLWLLVNWVSHHSSTRMNQLYQLIHFNLYLHLIELWKKRISKQSVTK